MFSNFNNDAKLPRQCYANVKLKLCDCDDLFFVGKL